MRRRIPPGARNGQDITSSSLLHNSGVPPRTMVSYNGLTDLTRRADPARVPVRIPGFASVGVFGTPVRFALPAKFKADTPVVILQALDLDGTDDPLHRLDVLINQRAAELPLPDGCLVIEACEWHQVYWPDALSALAVLTKCSDDIWLRTKTPLLQAALARRHASLLVPPGFVNRLTKVPK